MHEQCKLMIGLNTGSNYVISKKIILKGNDEFNDVLT